MTHTPSPTFINVGRVPETESAISAYLSALEDWPADAAEAKSLWWALDMDHARPATFGTIAPFHHTVPEKGARETLGRMVEMYATHGLPYLGQKV